MIFQSLVEKYLVLDVFDFYKIKIGISFFKWINFGFNCFNSYNSREIEKKIRRKLNDNSKLMG